MGETSLPTGLLAKLNDKMLRRPHVHLTHYKLKTLKIKIIKMLKKQTNKTWLMQFFKYYENYNLNKLNPSLNLTRVVLICKINELEKAIDEFHIA